MKPVELKRCPRCGAKAIRAESKHYSHVGCTGCGLRTRYWCRTGEAVKDWNKLAGELVRASTLEERAAQDESDSSPKALREMISSIQGWTLAKRSILEQVAEFHEKLNKLTEAAGQAEADAPRIQDRLAELFNLADGLSESGGKGER